MAFSHGSKARLYIAGYDLTGFLKGVKAPAEIDKAEVTTLNKTSRCYIPGLQTATLSAEGFYDGSAGAIDDVLRQITGLASAVMAHLPAGDGIGKTAVCMDAIETSYEDDTSVDDAAQLSFEAQSNVGAERCLILHALGAETVGGQAAGQDNTAPTTFGGAGYVIATVPAANAPTVKIQHSTDNNTYADLLTFNPLATGRFHQRQEVAPGVTINRYVRALWTTAGACPPFFVAFYRRPVELP